MTSKEGFSVVAPIKVKRPDSTWGKSASCWLLLKRWISSTNKIVWRPNCAMVCWACSIASRISFTPAKTAEMAMKSRWKACAESRAKVVLPTPGGPHKIIEWGWPEAKARFRGLPAANKWVWPMTASMVLGRKASANGGGGCVLKSSPILLKQRVLRWHPMPSKLWQRRWDECAFWEMLGRLWHC